ncbi:MULTISPECIES: hypothetical protein [unclassified Nonomuraea]
MLPGLDGFEVLRRIRATSQAPGDPAHRQDRGGRPDHRLHRG